MPKYGIIRSRKPKKRLKLWTVNADNFLNSSSVYNIPVSSPKPNRKTSALLHSVLLVGSLYRVAQTEAHTEWVVDKYRSFAAHALQVASQIMSRVEYFI